MLSLCAFLIHGLPLPSPFKTNSTAKTYYISITPKSEDIAETVLTWIYYSCMLNPFIFTMPEAGTFITPMPSMRKRMPEGVSGLFKIMRCQPEAVFKCSLSLPENQFKPYVMVKMPLLLQPTLMASFYTSGYVYYREAQLIFHKASPLTCNRPNVTWPVSYLIFFTYSLMSALCVCSTVVWREATKQWPGIWSSPF